MARPRAMRPILSVIVPTVTGREEWLAKCLAAYDEAWEADPSQMEVIVVKDERSCGEAWIKGAKKARGQYIHFTADDLLPEPGYFEAARAASDDGCIPVANVLTAMTDTGEWIEESTMQTMCYLQGGGAALNVLVPFFSRAIFELDDEWLAPIHYGSDDWVSFLADRLGILCPFIADYRFGHGAAPEGRLHSSRARDIPILCGLMSDHGEVPQPYASMGAQYGWVQEFTPAALAVNGLEFSPTTRAAVPMPRAVSPMQQALGAGYYWEGPVVAAPLDVKPPTYVEPEARRRPASSGFQVWTGSQFKNELDILEIRLGTIGDLVDHIVIAEATVDQRGREKPLNFKKRSARFKPWFKKIEYVVVDDMPIGDGREMDWVRERWQRNAILRGMDLAPDDRVFISDLDEIPTVEALKEAIADPPMRFLMDLHVYRLNWRWLDRNEQIATLGSVHLGQEFLDSGDVNAVCLNGPFRLRPDSGWHLTYQGDIPTLRAKMTGMADAFFEDLVPAAAKEGIDGPEDFLTDEWIQGSIDTGRDIYARDYRRTEWVPLDQLPPYVQAHPEKFAHMLIEKPKDA